LLHKELKRLAVSAVECIDTPSKVFQFLLPVVNASWVRSIFDVIEIVLDFHEIVTVAIASIHTLFAEILVYVVYIILALKILQKEVFSELRVLSKPNVIKKRIQI
jgi:hypothetical protein